MGGCCPAERARAAVTAALAPAAARRGVEENNVCKLGEFAALVTWSGGLGVVKLPPLLLLEGVHKE